MLENRSGDGIWMEFCGNFDKYMIYDENPDVILPLNYFWITNVDGVDAYLGSYNYWSDISASNISYITPENTGVTQFIVGLMKKV